MLAMQTTQVSNRIEVKSMTNTQPSLLSFSTWGKRLDTWRMKVSNSPLLHKMKLPKACSFKIYNNNPEYSF